MAAQPKTPTAKARAVKAPKATPIATPPRAPVAAIAPEPPTNPKGKLGEVIRLLRRPSGVQIAELMAATGWQAHSVRGAISGAVKKKHGHTVLSEKTEAGRTYRIVEPAAEAAA